MEFGMAPNKLLALSITALVVLSAAMSSAHAYLHPSLVASPRAQLLQWKGGDVRRPRPRRRMSSFSKHPQFGRPHTSISQQGVSLLQSQFKMSEMERSDVNAVVELPESPEFQQTSIASDYNINIVQQAQIGQGDIHINEIWELFAIKKDVTDDDDEQTHKSNKQEEQEQAEQAPEYLCFGTASIITNPNNVDEKVVTIIVQCNIQNNEIESLPPFVELVPFLLVKSLMNQSLGTIGNDAESECCEFGEIVLQYIRNNDPSSDGTGTVSKRIDISPSVAQHPTALYHSFLDYDEDGDENTDAPQFEMVDMVDEEGQPLLSLPRPLVHQHNILHRGAGILVLRSKDKSKPLSDSLSSSSTDPQSDWTKEVQVYCHRRTDTKRIFPSMYDMFVGGVSSTDESDIMTAGRELAEELGLQRALQDASERESTSTDTDGAKKSDQLPSPSLQGPLFRCTVQTSYNRCVVNVFIFLYNDQLDSTRFG
jgi:8-oxo-dGTP pyrophosphatase MutT (NUDIX family)